MNQAPKAFMSYSHDSEYELFAFEVECGHRYSLALIWECSAKFCLHQ